MYQIMDSNNNIRQHHANNVDPVLMIHIILTQNTDNNL